MVIEISKQEIEDNKFALLLAIKELDLHPENMADKQLSDRLDIFKKRLEKLQ